MDIDTVDQQTRLLVDAGHRVLQIHRFAKDEAAHVARLERWAEFGHGSRVLDMGSGTGEVARIMQDLRPDLEFTLVNISQAQLDYSPKHMRQHLGSFCNLPMADRSYDAVMFCFSIGHEDKLAALIEASRLLRNGGVVFIYDMARVDGDNSAMNRVHFKVDSASQMMSDAALAGLTLDWYMEPRDNGEYAASVIGDSYPVIFRGTVPAIWRFIK